MLLLLNLNNINEMYQKEKSWTQEFGTSSPNLQKPKYIKGQNPNK